MDIRVRLITEKQIKKIFYGTRWNYSEPYNENIQYIVLLVFNNGRQVKGLYQICPYKKLKHELKRSKTGGIC